MNVHSETVKIDTRGFCDIHDLSPQISTFMHRAKVQHGMLTVFVPGSTAGVTTIEYESGVLEDLRRAIERIAPEHIHYDHDAHWGDGNGFAHVRAALLKPSLVVPVVDGELQTGTWQQIVLIDFDNRPRQRSVVLQLFGT